MPSLPPKMSMWRPASDSIVISRLSASVVEQLCGPNRQPKPDFPSRLEPAAELVDPTDAPRRSPGDRSRVEGAERVRGVGADAGNQLVGDIVRDHRQFP